MCECEMCGGELCLLGQLGDLWWCRCRACGMEQTISEECLEGSEVDE